jgi:hypothetical protein
MAKQLLLPNPKNEPTKVVYERELLRLKDSAALRRRLSEIDNIKRFQRIYVMGCGRSGTWLLTNVLSTLRGADVVPKELAVEYFGLFLTERTALVLKRDAGAYQRVRDIPRVVKIAYIIRHPFDVLTSHLPPSGRPYHILPDRWLGEMTALQFLVSERSGDTKIIRYEDLARKPADVQSGLAEFFGLRVGLPIDDFYTVSNNPTESAATTGRPRKIDLNSIDKHRRDPEKIEYLKTIRPELGQTLGWVGQTFTYDTSL